MQTARALCLLALLFWGSGALAQSSAEKQQQLESQLLHRSLDLTGLQRWVRRDRRWEDYRVPLGKLLVLNLWQVKCKPCIDEMPLFRQMARAWRNEAAVSFLFVSNPPDLSVPAEIASFWRQDRDRVPDEDPLRAKDDRLQQVLSTGTVPLTLLVDPDGVIRHVFAGSIGDRGPELAGSISRLLKVLPKGGKRCPAK